MSAPILLGDEVTAAGYRLAGIEARVPAAGEEEAALRRACSEAPLVLITAQCAARIPADVLGRFTAAAQPLVLVVADARGLAPVPDLAARVRRQLGMQP